MGKVYIAVDDDGIDVLINALLGCKPNACEFRSHIQPVLNQLKSEKFGDEQDAEKY